MSKLFHTALALASTAFLTACASVDQYVFYSRVDRPATVTLYDPLGDKPLWTKDIPVGSHLQIDLNRRDENELASINTEKAATKMSWWLYGPDSDTEPVESNEMPLSGTPVVLKVTYRPSPEYPPDFIQTTPPSSPSQPQPPQSPESTPSPAPDQSNPRTSFDPDDSPPPSTQ